MTENKNKESGWFLLVFALTIVSAAAIALLAHGSDGQLQELRERRKHLKVRNEQLREKRDELQITRQRLHQDPQLIKKLAREKLGLVKPGEKVIWFKEPQDYLKRFEAKDSEEPQTVFEESGD
ncbi:MAG: FtsB family cell division protein [bacterium]